MSTSAFADRNIECKGKWHFAKTDATVTATVVNNTTVKVLSDDSLYDDMGDGATTEVNLIQQASLTADDYHARKYVGYTRFSYHAYVGPQYGAYCGLLLPENVVDFSRPGAGSFYAYDICQMDQDGGTLRLVCSFK